MHIHRATFRHPSVLIKVPAAPGATVALSPALSPALSGAIFLALSTLLISPPRSLAQSTAPNGVTAGRAATGLSSNRPIAPAVIRSAPLVRPIARVSPQPRMVAGPAAQEQAKDLNRQAIALQAQGKLTEACALYRQAIAIYPGGAGYHNNLALVLKDLDQSKEAEAQERIALKLRPKRADYHVNLGIILQRQKRLTEAEAAYKDALAMDASDSDCHYRLGQTYFELGDFDKAVEVTKLALMLKPDSAEYCELMGDIYTKKEQFDDALLEYRRVIELNGYTPATISGALHDKIEFLKTRLKSHP